MDAEALSSDSHVAAAIATRRRSNSVSDDYSVQRTNDDATQCKAFAIQKGYWKDEFIGRFASSLSNTSETRRFPEISMGYWARSAAIEKYVREFLTEHQGNAQVVSLGCGFDTLFWRLVSSGAKLVNYVEVDFSSVTSKKIRHILKPIGSDGVDLKKSFQSEAVVSHHADLHAGNYHLIGADLRQTNELNQKLDSCGLDYKVPTIFIAECVLVYMSSTASSALLKQLVSKFSTPAFVNYEQFRTSDAFTRVMEQNLGERGIQLHGLEMCEDQAKQEERFLNAGFKTVKVMDMQQILSEFLDQQEVQRIRKIENLDEMELLDQLLAHYCVVFARV